MAVQSEPNVFRVWYCTHILASELHGTGLAGAASSVYGPWFSYLCSWYFEAAAACTPGSAGTTPYIAHVYTGPAAGFLLSVPTHDLPNVGAGKFRGCTITAGLLCVRGWP